MKDILFEKHYDKIFEIDMGADTSKDKERFDAAVACANTTKEMMKGFITWIQNEIPYLPRGKELWVREFQEFGIDQVEYYTTEELLEKYLLTLNQ